MPVGKKNSVKIVGQQKKYSAKDLVGKKFTHLLKIYSLFADFFFTDKVYESLFKNVIKIWTTIYQNKAKVPGKMSEFRV